MCPFSGKTDNFDFFHPNLAKNEFWGRNFKNPSPDLKSGLPIYVCQFSVKTDNFDFFWRKFAQKGNGIWGQNFKNLSLDSESASLRYYVNQFSELRDNVKFLGPNLLKKGFWARNFKNLSLDSKSTPPIYHVCQFLVKMDNF